MNSQSRDVGLNCAKQGKRKADILKSNFGVLLVPVIFVHTQQTHIWGSTHVSITDSDVEI